MDKVVFCLLVLAGICCSSAEVDFEEIVPEATHPPIEHSTSDSFVHLFSDATEENGEPDPRAAQEKNDDPDPRAAQEENDDPDPRAAQEENDDPNPRAAQEENDDPDPRAAQDENDDPNPRAAQEENVDPDQTAISLNEEYLNKEDEDLASSSDVCEKELSRADMQTFERAMNAFSKDLLKQVQLESNSPNVVVSPFSIALGLLQLALGAKGETEKKILETLHVESLQCLHEKLQKVTRRLVESSLNVATRMYVKKDFQIKKCFMNKSEQIYGTKPVNLKQNMKENLEAVNKWVKDATKGKITNFLSNIPSNVVLMLLNAIYFKGSWRNRFDPAKTIQDVFNINDEEAVMVDMMQSMKYPLSYFIHEKLDSQVARLPFKGNMSFVVVMPLQMNWNLSRILDKLNRTELYNRFHKEKPTALKVPKLNLDFKLELTHVLSNLGLGQLFSHPNLTGISDEPLFVSSIEHQSTLQLSEEGVEAAAATASITSRSLSTFSINRPFLYFLFDDITGLPLFQGYVLNPKPGSQKKRKEPSFIPELKPVTKGFIPK